VRCEEFEQHLNDLLDERRRADGDAELSAHASTCAACERSLRDYEALLEGVALLEAPEPSAELAARVLARHAATARSPRRRLALAGLALAATVVVAALPAVGW